MTIRRFPLLRYYVIGSFLAIAVISALLGSIMAREVHDDLLEKAKSHAVRVLRYVQQDIQTDFLEPLLATGAVIDLEQNDAQYDAINTVVRRVADAFGLLDVYIFDQQGVIVYASRREHIGMRTPESNQLFRIALTGKVASAVRQRGAPLDIAEGSEVPLLETYVPVRSITEQFDGDDAVANVIEAYQDLDEFQRAVTSAQQRIVLATAIGGLLLFGILFWIVRYADRLIQKRTDELLSSNLRLTELSKDLEMEVDRRTKQLIQQEKLASLGTLAAGLAHELNNPLATVSASAQGLRSRLQSSKKGEPFDSDDVEEYVDLIIDESFRVKEITRSLLDFSRQQPGDRVEPIDASKILAEATTLLRVGPDLDEIDVVLPESQFIFSGDATTFRQLSFNVMKNAMDSIRERLADQPTPRGRIRWFAQQKDGELELSCQDNGVGFPPERASELVEPFFTTKSPGSGTGLGLALCHSMASRMGGRLELSSDGIGCGATVRLTVPANGDLS